jgi:AraC-like DNA-binding protein
MATRGRPIEQVRWRPAGAYPLAIEVQTIAQLRRKAPRSHFERWQRVQFFVLTGVTRGATRHQIDFAAVDARPGTWWLLRPGQLQRFDFSRPWSGWMVVFRPELQPPPGARDRAPPGTLDALLTALPAAVDLPPAAHAHCCDAVRRMAADAGVRRGSVEARDRLMLHQLGEVLARLALQAGATRDAPPPNDDERVARLRALVDREPQARHPAAWYAQRLGCSTRTLARAVHGASGLALKPWLDERRALEAKRALVHGDEPIKRVADRLGFVDPANFVKFFRRMTGTTPAAFRAQPGAGGA